MTTFNDEPDVLVVDEQLDTNGDLIYAVQIKTYSRGAIDHLAGVLNRRVQFRTHNPHDYIDD